MLNEYVVTFDFIAHGHGQALKEYKMIIAAHSHNNAKEQVEFQMKYAKKDLMMSGDIAELFVKKVKFLR